MYSSNQRRRSYSIAGGQPCENYWRGNLKAAYSRQSGSWSRDTASSSPPKWEVEGWRADKRRRRDQSPGHLPDSSLSHRPNGASEIALSLAPSFACTPAEFHLFPRIKRDSRRKTSNAFEDADMDEPEGCNATHLSSLRSYAFWELHTSIIQNGEGFVQKMRDYENSRSRSNAYQKAKEAQKRGRKRSGIAGCRKRMTQSLHPPVVEDDGSDDDIFILAADLSPRSNARSPRHKRRQISSEPISGDRRAPPKQPSSSTNSSRPASFLSDDDIMVDSPLSDIGQSWCSDGISLGSTAPSSLPSSPSSTTDPQSTYSEKAIAALSLAMANGAVGLNDYQALLAIQETPAIDACQVGEMFD